MARGPWTGAHGRELWFDTELGDELFFFYITEVIFFTKTHMHTYNFYSVILFLTKVVSLYRHTCTRYQTFGQVLLIVHVLELSASTFINPQVQVLSTCQVQI